MNKTIAVLSTGAIGSSIGADFTRAGYNVLLIDQWPAHVDAMKARGLHITMPGEEFQIPVQAVHLCELCGLQRQFDIVFLAAKSYDTCWMVHFIKPYLKADGVLVSMQNSLNDEWIAPIVGYERDIGCALELSAEVFEPGRVKRNTDRTHTRFVLGELHGRVTSRLQEVAEIVSTAGKTEVSTNIWGAKWTKLVANTMFMALDAIAGVRSWELVQDPQNLDLCIKLGKESMEVGTALGYTLEPLFGLTREELLGATDEVLRTLVMALISDMGREARSCILQDLLKGRPTEIGDYLNELVVKKGREAKVPTPVNEAVTSLIKQLEQGKLKPDPSNLKLLDQYR